MRNRIDLTKKKFIFLDTETTGLNPYNNAIVQVAGIIRIGGRIQKRFDLKCKAHHGAKIDVNERLHQKHRLKSGHAFQRFLGILEDYIDIYNKNDKFYLVAYNERHDTDFLRAWFKRNQNNFYGSYFWNPSHCVMQRAALKLMQNDERHKIENMKLETVCKYFGLNVDRTRLHDAAYDALLAKNLWNTLAKK